jgi:hypothetical protein
MTSSECSVELAGVNLSGRNHVCAFVNTIDEEHRVLGSFYKNGIDRGEKAVHIVDPENREEHLKRLADWTWCRGLTHMCATVGSTRTRCWLQSKT